MRGHGKWAAVMLHAARMGGRPSLLVCIVLATAGAAAQLPPAQPAPSSSPAAQTPIAPTQAAQPPGALPQSVPSEWRAYSFPDEGFSALFPLQPLKQKQSVPAGNLTLDLHSYTVETAAMAMEVDVCDYGEAIHDSDADAILEGARNGAVTSAKAQLIASRKIMLGIYPGIAFEAGVDQLHLSARIYLVGTILYQTFVSKPADQPDADTKKFLDSFQLIPRPVQ